MLEHDPNGQDWDETKPRKTAFQLMMELGAPDENEHDEDTYYGFNTRYSSRKDWPMPNPPPYPADDED